MCLQGLTILLLKIKRWLPNVHKQGNLSNSNASLHLLTLSLWNCPPTWTTRKKRRHHLRQKNRVSINQRISAVDILSLPIESLIYFSCYHLFYYQLFTLINCWHTGFALPPFLVNFVSWSTPRRFRSFSGKFKSFSQWPLHFFCGIMIGPSPQSTSLITKFIRSSFVVEGGLCLKQLWWEGWAYKGGLISNTPPNISNGQQEIRRRAWGQSAHFWVLWDCCKRR